jgi:hypothetical protein
MTSPLTVDAAPGVMTHAHRGRGDLMEAYSEGTGGGGRAARAAQISMEDFIETATRAALRALAAAGLNPQPLPPREPTPSDELNPQPEPPGAASELNPQPLPPFDVTVGLIISTGEGISVLRGSKI